MGCTPAASIDTTTGGYSHSLPAPRVAVIPMIYLTTWWWNPSRTLAPLCTLSSVTSHLVFTLCRSGGNLCMRVAVDTLELGETENERLPTGKRFY